MSGSVSVVRQLLTAGLLDELHLLVHPIAIRKDIRLFDAGESAIPPRLVSSQAFTTGVLHLIYAPAESTPTGTYDDAETHFPNLRTADTPHLGETRHRQMPPRSGARRAHA